MKLALILVGSLALLVLAAGAFFVFVTQNVETPTYQVIDQDAPYELRDYPGLIVAEVRRSGSRRESLSAGFGTLARYIFARERSGPSIAMTAPVTQQRRGPIAMTAPVVQSQTSGGDWVVRFIMPAEYDFADLPTPGGSDVALQSIPPQRRAVIRFSGKATDEVLAAQEMALLDWMAERGLAAAGPPVYAYYNDPFTPPFLRRYEVLIDVAGTHEGR
jgi:hypothetical protein